MNTTAAAPLGTCRAPIAWAAPGAPSVTRTYTRTYAEHAWVEVPDSGNGHDDSHAHCSRCGAQDY